MNVLAGLYRPDSGEIYLHGRRAEIHSPRDARRHRVGMVHQEQRLVTRFAAPENIAIGASEPRFLLLGGDFRRLAARLSRRYGLEVDAETQIWQLPLGRRQRVELVKLLHHGAEIIILDEPTSNLAPAEVESFFRAIRQLVDQGRTVILITHRMDEVLRYADWVTVMRAGQVVANFPVGLVSRDEINRLMVGEEGVGRENLAEAAESPGEDSTGERVPPLGLAEPGLVVRDLAAGEAEVADALHGATLEVRPGEVVAIAGVAGNGQTLLAEAITGGLADYSGRVALDGRDLRGLSRRAVARLGVAYIPENRKEVGLLLGESVALNLALRGFDRPPFSRGGWVDYAALGRQAEALIERYRIRTPSPWTAVGRLSGGNQQRVIVARELAGEPRLVVADNFTRGLDPQSTAQCIAALFAQRDLGAAVVWITSDLAEALECDRIAVLRRGRIVDVLPRATASREQLGLLMSGDESPTRA
jgi:simple sugar transport system ATP-binding protein